ncbi:hypothetical protein J7E78_01345 [Paenibacillus polymyxa]|uniref:hypothetical protein n=1 Tax=Paenibacillus polymyxa TaxID=1406 RepID=UPI001BE66E4A|nr:hypothetical protein [Paenibacillus polymyxa]MBT2282197.1 hypothetical protein [Paenibacillus polymyxa]
MIGDQLLIEVNYIPFPDGDWEVTVTGFSGRFDLTELQRLISNLRGHIPLEVKQALEKECEKEKFITYFLEVIYEPEECRVWRWIWSCFPHSCLLSDWKDSW